MLQRERIGEGWLGELHAGEDAQGRPVRFTPLIDWNEAERQWLLERIKLMNTHAVTGACPQLGLQVVQGIPSWVAAWRDGVQLSVVLEHKHMPNTVIMSVVYGVLQSLHSAQQKGLIHGALHPNGIWLGLDGVVWIDGFGQYPTDTMDSTQDVYELGCLLIEMFLGECPFPVAESDHGQTLINIGLELKALGLPSKLPRQIIRLVHPDPSKRPSLDVLIDKWKLTRGKTIVASWVREQYPQLINESKPENRIPTARRIAPKPTPQELQISVPSPISVVEDDEPTMRAQPVTEASMDGALTWEDEHTEQAPVEHSEESVEETQVMKFFAEFDANSPDSEPTSKLVVNANLVDENIVEMEKVSLAEEMGIPSRRTWTGVLWIGVVGILTGAGLYWTIPSIPSFAESTVTEVNAESEESAVKMAKPINLVGIPIPSNAKGLGKLSEGQVQKVEDNEINKGKKVEEGSKSVPNLKKSDVPSMAPVIEQPVRTPPKKTVRKVTHPVVPVQQKDRPLNAKPSTKLKEQVYSKPEDVGSPNKEPTPLAAPSESVEQSDALPVEKVEPVTVSEVTKPKTGSVSVTGDAKLVRLEKDGREFTPGQLAPGVYTVYVTFEGFNEFKTSPLTVRANGQHRIECDSLFATCQVK